MLPEYAKIQELDLDNHEQKPDTIIHEIHMMFPSDKGGGYAIRFVEAPDTPEWYQDAAFQAQEDALCDLYQNSPDRAEQTGNWPRITLHKKHESWAVLKKSRGIDEPAMQAITKDETTASTERRRRAIIQNQYTSMRMRKEKVPTQVQQALDFIDTLPPMD